MTISTPTRLTGVAVLLATIGLAPPAMAEPGKPPRCARLAPATGERAPLDETRQEMVAEALEDEYHGQALYSRVLEELGETRPFANVVRAEGRHATLLEELLQSRDLPVPPNPWNDADLPTYSSRRDACAAAVEFEEGNVALYDRLLADDALPEDVRRVFEHNRMASLEHHKPAFERCAAGGGGRGQGAVASGRGGCRGRGHCGASKRSRGCDGCDGGGCASGGCACHGHGRGGHGCGHGRGASASAAEESGS
jgi:hypothetical protein